MLIQTVFLLFAFSAMAEEHSSGSRAVVQSSEASDFLNVLSPSARQGRCEFFANKDRPEDVPVLLDNVGTPIGFLGLVYDTGTVSKILSAMVSAGVDISSGEAIREHIKHSREVDRAAKREARRKAKAFYEEGQRAWGPRNPGGAAYVAHLEKYLEIKRDPDVIKFWGTLHTSRRNAGQKEEDVQQRLERERSRGVSSDSEAREIALQAELEQAREEYLAADAALGDADTLYAQLVQFWGPAEERRFIEDYPAAKEAIHRMRPKFQEATRLYGLSEQLSQAFGESQKTDGPSAVDENEVLASALVERLPPGIKIVVISHRLSNGTTLHSVQFFRFPKESDAIKNRDVLFLTHEGNSELSDNQLRQKLSDQFQSPAPERVRWMKCPEPVFRAELLLRGPN